MARGYPKDNSVDWQMGQFVDIASNRPLSVTEPFGGIRIEYALRIRQMAKAIAVIDKVNVDHGPAL